MINTAIYPSVSAGPAKVEIEIERKSVKIEYSEKDGLCVIEGNKKIFEVQAKPRSFRLTTFQDDETRFMQEITVHGHKLRFRFQDSSSVPLVGMFFLWLAGLQVWVDDRPVQGTCGDPDTQITIASYGLYTLSGSLILRLLSAIATQDPTPSDGAMVIALAVAGGLAFLGSQTKKRPILATSLGLIYGFIATSSVVMQIIGRVLTENAQASSVFPLLIWGCIPAGATLALFRGFLGVLKLRKT
ncbi:hypothetical protein EXS70_00580 [Candidatus Peribacteria bacterium]|nr:hypothetical protein [Candidatus Peribacteria bacterium]